MCEWGATERVELRRPAGEEAMVDKCIASTIRAMQDAGLRTTSSCCGHGKISASIVLEVKDLPKALEILAAPYEEEAATVDGGLRVTVEVEVCVPFQWCILNWTPQVGE